MSSTNNSPGFEARIRDVITRARDAFSAPRIAFRELAVPLQLDVFFNFLALPRANHLWLSSYEGIPRSEAKEIQTLNYGHAVCGTVALTRRAMLVQDVQHVDDEKVSLIRQFGVKAYNCNPLLAGDRLLGTLSFGSRRRTEFADDELRLMQQAASDIADRLAALLPHDVQQRQRSAAKSR